MEEPVCKRCGRCCWYEYEPGTMKKCRYLIQISPTITACRIYRNRLGTKIGINKKGKECFCVTKEFSLKNDDHRILECVYEKEWEENR